MIRAISVISSKSYTIRLLLCAYLSNQEVEIKNNNYSKDVLATINVLKSLGSKIIINKDNLIIKPGNKVNAFNLYIQNKTDKSKMPIYYEACVDENIISYNYINNDYETPKSVESTGKVVK